MRFRNTFLKLLPSSFREVLRKGRRNLGNFSVCCWQVSGSEWTALEEYGREMNSFVTNVADLRWVPLVFRWPTLQTWGEFLFRSHNERLRWCLGVVCFSINTFTHCCLYYGRINRMPAFWRWTDRKSNLVTCIKNSLVTWLRVVCSNLLASGP